MRAGGVESVYPLSAQMPSAQWHQYQNSLSRASLGLDTRNPAAAFAMDAPMHHHPPIGYPTDGSFHPNASSMSMNYADAFDEGDTKDSPLDMELEGATHPETAGKRKKASSSSQANDNELRRLFRENEGRDLHEVSQQVLRDEKGPKSEKSKQIFGMLWYLYRTARCISCPLTPRLGSAPMPRGHPHLFRAIACSRHMRPAAARSACRRSTQHLSASSSASFSLASRPDVWASGANQSITTSSWP